MIRFIAFAVALGACLWLVLGELQFRKSIRTSLSKAYELMHRVDPSHASDNGKVLNAYYEDVYRELPNMVAPACLAMAASTVLLMTRRRPKPDPGASRP